MARKRAKRMKSNTSQNGERKAKISKCHHPKSLIRQKLLVLAALVKLGFFSIAREANSFVRVLRSNGNKIIAWLGLILAVTYSPIPPHSPNVEPGLPANSYAFDIPFKVVNKSSVFSMHEVRFFCKNADVLTTNYHHIIGLRTTNDRKNTISPSSSAQYKCEFVLDDGKAEILEASIYIEVEFKTKFWPFNRNRSYGPYVWNSTLTPPRWHDGPRLL